MADIFEEFSRKAPVAVMAGASLDLALEPTALDALFAEHAERRYEKKLEKKLLFSTMLDVAAWIVCRVQPSVRAAYQAMRRQVPVLLTAVYDKPGGVEMATTEARVAHRAFGCQAASRDRGARYGRSVAAGLPHSRARRPGVGAVSHEGSAKHLVAWVAHSDGRRFRKAVRSSGKPTPERNRFKDKPHVSTARLLVE